MDLKKIYIAHGMVRRDDEIWQYYVGSERYHSPWTNNQGRDAVFRAVQRLDGFISADTAYTGGSFTTRPFTFRFIKVHHQVTDVTESGQFVTVHLRIDEGSGLGVIDPLFE